MARKKKDEEVVDETPVEETEEESTEPVEEPSEDVEDEPVKDIKDKKGATEAVVKNNGSVVRVYSLESHGKDFVSLAKEFCSHSGRESYVVELQ